MPSAAPIAVAALHRWLLVQSVLWLPALAALVVFAPLPPLVRTPLAALVPLSHLSLVLLLRAGARTADQVTIARALMASLALLLAKVANDWLCFALLVLAVSGDLADGAVARRHGPTEQGAVLDMETDQLTVLVLAWLCCERGIVASVLVVPAMRWLYVLAMRWRQLPAWEPRPTGDNARGRTVCAIVVGSLLFAVCPAVPTLAGGIAAHGGALLLVWSFSADARWLLAPGGRP